MVWAERGRMLLFVRKKLVELDVLGKVYCVGVCI